MPWRKAVFILLVLFCLSPWGSPPVALALGILLAVTFGNPFPELHGKTMRYLLQSSVVLLGFGMDVSAVYEAGKQGVLFTVATIFGTLALGYVLGRLLGVGKRTSTLISAGTAICGGSAIAAVGPAIDAKPEEMSVSLGTVFVLNSIALFLFPIIGHGLDQTQSQFGIWAAIAIHDTSSVVGAAQIYGAEAMATATTVKLVRALWIVPLAVMFAYIYRRGKSESSTRIAFPYFIFFFLLAAIVRTYAPDWIFPSIFDSLVNLAKAGMILTLFLIGSSLSPQTIKSVGVRPLIQGILLWIVISLVSLWAVLGFLG
jgi:uncharacterized integral membrane protein (TIGR00698 family)